MPIITPKPENLAPLIFLVRGDLKDTGKDNLFVIFGEPDIAILPAEDGKLRIKVNGVDVCHPSPGEVLPGPPSDLPKPRFHVNPTELTSACRLALRPPCAGIGF